jgi:hypothetical protein
MVLLAGQNGGVGKQVSLGSGWAQFKSVFATMAVSFMEFRQMVN